MTLLFWGWPLDRPPPTQIILFQYDTFVDIWCIGILIYEFLVGKAPFELESAHETLARIKLCKVG